MTELAKMLIPEKKTDSGASASSAPKLTPAEEQTLKKAKDQLEKMNKMSSRGIMMDEDQREEIESTIKFLEKKKGK